MKYRHSQCEPLPMARLMPLCELVSNAEDVRTSRPRPMPLERTTADARGTVYRYWSDGSLRRER